MSLRPVHDHCPTEMVIGKSTCPICDDLYLVYELTGPRHNHVSQLLILHVPVSDVRERDHHQHGHQVLTVQHKVFLLYKISNIPGNKAASLLLFKILQTGLQVVVC